MALIVENYVGHNIYISEKYYEEIFERKPKENKILLNMTEEYKEDKVLDNLIEIKGVTGVSSVSGLKENFDNTIKSLDYVVFIMIFAAGALAFVVLYNLTNVNISERIREIATIKVLGFYDKEVSAYIYRENIILTLIGIIVGLFIGIGLHKFIMITVELESLMFGRNIDSVSFVYATLITIGFSILVNMFMYYKLKNVKMVESLKSVD